MPSVEFNRLRKILAEPTSQRLDRVEDQLTSIEERLEASHKAEEVSEVLPEAMRIGARKGPELANTLGPIVESALDKSIERNTDRVASALYPVLGAMVRKYVGAAVHDATESINLLVARALTLEGMRWRWESARTGVSVDKIAFRHSLVYRCEHVFLIHNKTAQPLFHLTAAEAIEADKLAFAGMLGAITDFIKDAFLREEPIGLRSISVRDFTIWFEEGPLTTIAVVIRGEPQPPIRYRLRNVSAQLHEHYSSELENAMVDEVSLLNYDTLLRGTLVQQRRDEQKRKRRLGRIATTSIASILAIIGLADLNGVRVAHARDDRFERFVTDLKNRDGMLITDYGKRGGKYFLSGVVTGSLSSAALPFEDFGLSRDEVDVKLLSHVAAIDESKANEQLRNFLDQLDELDGAAWPTHGSRRDWLRSTTDRIVNAYVLGQALGRPFIIVIKHPAGLKESADTLSGQLSWRLYLEGVYDRGLVRTLQVDKQPPVLTVLQERTFGK